ncbi:hypothetical protein DEO72_LG11g2495 [Vigna unguiculata]|uniref:Uncharacterized protein n=1 Tax=Vigna unguiculata TaxID=3917 RepID=A0A4D6NS26_VIGUN|nr:hypothetical protein DEO72_LG11g2495 [Vigna unguiculata]
MASGVAQDITVKDKINARRCTRDGVSDSGKRSRHNYGRQPKHNNLSKITDTTVFKIPRTQQQQHVYVYVQPLRDHTGPELEVLVGPGPESKTAKKDPNQSSTGGSKQNPTRLKPRFAPEFDGLHCFESIVPSIAAAAGFYFIGRNDVKEIKQGSLSSQKMLAEVKERAKSLQTPKLAPQFDGLDCFETLVMN